MAAPEKALYHTTRTSSVFYNGCARSDCKGERISGFDWCIVHLSAEECELYASRLQARQAELVISAVNVDMNFVKGWIDRISTIVDGDTIVPVPVRMQDTVLVGSLEFRKITFEHGINLTKLRAYDVRMFEVAIGGELRLIEAVLDNELALADNLTVDDLLMSWLQAKIIGLSRGISINGRLDATHASADFTHLSRIEIAGPADFTEASLSSPGNNVYISADFKSSVNFSRCRFLGETQIGSVGDEPPSKFRREATFDGATFGSDTFGSLTMKDCVFEGEASFSDTEIYGAVAFDDAKFLQAARLNKIAVKSAPFKRGPRTIGDQHATAFSMVRTAFESSLILSANVENKAKVEDLTFPGVIDEFAINSCDDLQLTRVTLETSNSLTLLSTQLVAVERLHMNGGGNVRVSGRMFNLSDFTCANPVLIQSLVDQQEHPAKPKLIGLKGTNCDGLTLSGFDYSETVFLGAAKLDSLIITGEFILRSTHGTRARRVVLAEEATARAASQYWTKLAGGPPRGLNSSIPEPRDLAGVYRALRKAREDQKDAPGSADFYYGEMEMRRLSSAPRSMERAILTAYWLISGYGLRAWRALTTLAVVIVGSAAILSFFTLQSGPHPPPPSFAAALIFSAQSGLQLAGSSDRYTTVGQVFELVLRVLEPGLIALALFAVRGRVKR
ncbi:pentapeptide repeat-containing protein [Mycobacterium asiaticum]|uniref:pentapeptide repeat-containing protein n=1 Tax=Mycobacterium asiaticum TaxID=1790 RepID=UPI000568D226|nr:pentapeptide repeat-containing protein [Mycobacterium asiaticum]ORA17094.1 hypothetical protein BST16_05355 [Mycobacterium asiaticum DSM 44297]